MRTKLVIFKWGTYFTYFPKYLLANLIKICDCPSFKKNVAPSRRTIFTHTGDIENAN